MKIIFSGDICFRGLLFDDAQKCEKALEDVLPRFKSSDFRIANPETPMADSRKHMPIKKSGSNIISSKDNITFLKVLGIDAVTLTARKDTRFITKSPYFTAWVIFSSKAQKKEQEQILGTMAIR